MAPLTLADAFTAWQFAPVVSAALALAGAPYLAGVWLVARRHPGRPWPARRTLAFLLALGAVAFATQGSPAVYDDVLFSSLPISRRRNLARQAGPGDAVTSVTCLPPGASWP